MIGWFTNSITTNATVQSYLDTYGLLAVFSVFLLEGAMLLYFAPSESLVPTAVIFLAESIPDVGLILCVAVCGATLGQATVFLLAKRGGRDWVVHNRFLSVDDAHLTKFEGWFDRWGVAAIPLSNALPFTRGMLTIPAGLGAVRTAHFIGLSALGTLIFESVLAAITLVLVGPL